jgi:hypothetical protein
MLIPNIDMLCRKFGMKFQPNNMIQRMLFINRLLIPSSDKSEIVVPNMNNFNKLDVINLYSGSVLDMLNLGIDMTNAEYIIKEAVNMLTNDFKAKYIQTLSKEEIVAIDSSDPYYFTLFIENEYGSAPKISITRKRFEQLHREYIDPDFKLFLKRVYRLLLRYETLGYAGCQAAIPESVFDVLYKLYKVDHECFASPLNHYLKSYGSAFIDTDGYFGSKGDFFTQRYDSGSYEANPPFLEEYLCPVAMYILHLMEQANKNDRSLTFVCIWPAWSDTPGSQMLQQSEYTRHFIKLDKKNHKYKEGIQHRIDRLRDSEADSFIYIVQSNKSLKEYNYTTDEVTKEIRMAFRGT